jgi:hypothetical protein
MDNKLNEIRRKISRLRAEMLSLQAHIRDLVNHDMDCSEPSIRLLAMRSEMVALIARRNAMGGGEVCPNIAERLRADVRPPLRRGASRTEKPGRSRAVRSGTGGGAQMARPTP